MLAHLKMSLYAEFVWLHCCFSQHSNASSSTLLHTLQIFAVFVYFALVPSHALGASTSRAATLFLSNRSSFRQLESVFGGVPSPSVVTSPYLWPGARIFEQNARKWKWIQERDSLLWNRQQWTFCSFWYFYLQYLIRSRLTWKCSSEWK